MFKKDVYGEGKHIYHYGRVLEVEFIGKSSRISSYTVEFVIDVDAYFEKDPNYKKEIVVFDRSYNSAPDDIKELFNYQFPYKVGENVDWYRKIIDEIDERRNNKEF